MYFGRTCTVHVTCILYLVQNSLLRLEPSDVNKIALECFACVMRYMGDLPLLKNQHEVDCVNTILMYCHKFEAVRNEVYCQMMKQTTTNKSAVRVGGFDRKNVAHVLTGTKIS